MHLFHTRQSSNLFFLQLPIPILSNFLIEKCHSNCQINDFDRSGIESRRENGCEIDIFYFNSSKSFHVKCKRPSFQSSSTGFPLGIFGQFLCVYNHILYYQCQYKILKYKIFYVYSSLLFCMRLPIICNSNYYEYNYQIKNLTKLANSELMGKKTSIQSKV